MKYSKLVGKTVRDAPTDAVFDSHKLLYKGGFIRESTAGRYYFLPLGWRVHEKIKAIIKNEMDKTGAQEMIVPVLHPLHLWQETNRTQSAGFELMTIKDGREFQFALGGTAEEMFVDLVRNLKLSYRDLPFNIYQFSTKFRDEIRARGGLLRVREFVMKDAYSFDRNDKEFNKVYEQMAKTYSAIFSRLGLTTTKVEADNGYIGGEYCHEFQVESAIGEGRFFVSENGKYSAHEDVAKFKRDNKNIDEPLKPYKTVEAIRGTTMEDGVKLHGLPLWQQMKCVMFFNQNQQPITNNQQLILAVIRGDYDVNETKLAHLVGAYHLRHATVEEIHSIGSEPGFISPVGLKGKVKIVGDISLRTVRNMYGGVNKKHLDSLNMNIDRDFTVDIEGDIAMAQPGFLAEDGKSKLVEKRGIEVGNIFQLGYHYTKLMKGANFIDEDGKEKPYYMGCYGIGIGRTLAAIVEKFHDEKGIIWPKAVAPYDVHVVEVKSREYGVKRKAEEICGQLEKAGIEVLWDDRENVSPGVKFADADLIGIPWRAVVSAKTGEKVELKRRNAAEARMVSVAELVSLLSC
ncbi:proline--tRNA ligase [Candidatus Collierbacteria bacterium]|nr:proline--tRNA ligase [Candidatus Collierbacteria bacterium]